MPSLIAPAMVRRQRLAVIASAIAVCVVIFPFTAKPLGWDSILYMGLAFHPEPQGMVLNRYAHIYAMRPFMWLAGDPYVGARLFWSMLLGLTVAALVWAAMRLREDRGWVFALTLFLLAGQETIFAFPGVPLADSSVMAAMTAALCLVLPIVSRGEEISARQAATLGLLFLLGMKAKETALPLILFAGVLLIAPSGSFRFDRAARLLVLRWAAGVAAGTVAIMALDGVWLGDPLFSLRPRTWSELVEYNLRAAPIPATTSWLGWMLRPESFASFGLYLAAGLAWSRHESDRRLLLLYALPALFLLQLTVASTFTGAIFSERYTIPILPAVCLLAAMAFVRLIREERARAGARVEAGAWIAVVALCLLAVASVAAGARLVAFARSAARPAAEPISIVVAPMLILTAFISLTLMRAWPRLCIAVLAVTIATAGALPIRRVASALASRRVQREAAARFAGFYQVARAVRVEPDAIVFVSENLYGGSIRRGAVAAITRMNFNVPLASAPVVGDAPPAGVDYAVVGFDEYRRWRSDGAPPERAVVSDDASVALLCLRRPCTLRAP